MFMGWRGTATRHGTAPDPGPARESTSLTIFILRDLRPGHLARPVMHVQGSTMWKKQLMRAIMTSQSNGPFECY